MERSNESFLEKAKRDFGGVVSREVGWRWSLLLVLRGEEAVTTGTA